MTTYTNIFGGSNIAAADASYSSYSLTISDINLSWPIETNAESNLATTIIDVLPYTANRTLYLPRANEASVGTTILFNNLGVEQFNVKDVGGNLIVAPTPGSIWQIYLVGNSTATGSWRAYQYGAALSVANAAALAGTGIIALGSVLSQSMPIGTYSTNYTLLIPDRANTFLWNGGAGVFTLPEAVQAGNNWFVQFKNGGSGTVLVSTIGADLIDGFTSIYLQPQDSCIVMTDGQNYYTLGLGQTASFAFDYISINVAGAGDYTLTGSELNRISYNFTGLLTGNRTIIVPNTVQQYWVTNSTTGAYTLTVRTSLTTGVDINPNTASILYSNGTQVRFADSSGVGFPIAISQGGTGATSAAAAVINLGLNPVDGGGF
jgi:hypothetical protein